MQAFSKTIVTWHKAKGRHDLPWQQGITPYRVWISEIMLQQTQVQTVIGYYQRFMEHFPTVNALAMSDEDSVLALWSGLGYYRRARFLHQASKLVVSEFDGVFPVEPDKLVHLPGIGQSTAHAIASIAGELPFAILDANVIRVLTRFYAIDSVLNSKVEKQLWSLATSLMPPTDCRAYTQGMMDLGAIVCRKKPQCDLCPLQSQCQAYLLGLHNTLPRKPVKKPKPEKTMWYLLYTYQDKIALIQRDASSVWPRLWCLPEQSTQPTSSIEPLLQLEHTFSHYTLHMRIIRMECETMVGIDYAFFSIKQALSMGIPRPIRTVLEHVATLNDCHVE